MCDEDIVGVWLVNCEVLLRVLGCIVGCFDENK